MPRISKIEIRWRAHDSIASELWIWNLDEPIRSYDRCNCRLQTTFPRHFRKLDLGNIDAYFFYDRMVFGKRITRSNVMTFFCTSHILTSHLFLSFWHTQFKFHARVQKCHQIHDLGQYKLRLFSKRTHGISKILFNLGSCEFLARLESKIRKCLFFDGSLL